MNGLGIRTRLLASLSIFAIAACGEPVDGGQRQELESSTEATQVKEDGADFRVPDPSFGVNGRVRFQFFGKPSIANDLLAVRSGHLIVTGGGSGFGALAAFNLDGSPDAHFGSAGQAMVPLFTGPVASSTLDVSGNILVGGSQDLQALLARVTHRGVIDTSFGQDGYRALPITPEQLLSGADGRVVVVAATPPGSVTLARYTRDGNPDLSFGNQGVVTHALNPTVSSNSNGLVEATLLPEGKLLVAGASCSRCPGGAVHLLRLEPDGSLDTTFGSGGRLRTMSDLLWSMDGFALTPDGTFLAHGTSANGRGALALFNLDGSLIRSMSTRFLGAPSDGIFPPVDFSFREMLALAEGEFLLPVSSTQSAAIGIARGSYLPNTPFFESTTGFYGLIEYPAAPGARILGPQAVLQPRGGVVVAGTLGPNASPETDSEIIVSRFPVSASSCQGSAPK